jgi:hypothetical protein
MSGSSSERLAQAFSGWGEDRVSQDYLEVFDDSKARGDQVGMPHIQRYRGVVIAVCGVLEWLEPGF